MLYIITIVLFLCGDIELIKTFMFRMEELVESLRRDLDVMQIEVSK